MEKLTFDVVGGLHDERRGQDSVLDANGISICYTLQTDDITTGEKPRFNAYYDRTGKLTFDKGRFVHEETDSTLSFEPFGDGVLFHLKSGAKGLSEFGVNLPFNFMGKLDGGGWENQYLFNSPYISKDKHVLYAYLTKPNGANLVVAVLGGADGWKMDYATFYGGSYFISVKLLANFDRAYKTPRRENELSFCILPVGDFDDCLTKLAAAYDLPMLDYDVSGGALGSKFCLKAYGKIDSLIFSHGDEERVVPYSSEWTIAHEGETTITPVYQGRRGAEVTVYGYDDIRNLYRRSMDTVDLDVVAKTDGNLCEHQCWGSAMLRFLLKYKDTISAQKVAEYEKKVKVLLDVVTETDENKAVARRTILDHATGDYPAYNIFQSRRIQEEFFGITLLLDAYNYFKDEKYYRYAVCTTDSLIENYQKEDGRFETGGTDYSTVCNVMIPLVDMANFLAGKDDARSKKYFASAERLAAHLYRRGTWFPTEGGDIGGPAEPIMEDGSISCTALSLMYYCKNVKRVEKYVERAKEVLDLHESWVIRTPICQMKCSSLRWWETKWEGDQDGPAICAGHAWTIWRAEADYLYYALTKDEKYAKKAHNGFMTNLSKIDEKGKSYSIYNPDMINGGGFAETADEVVYRIAPHFADQEDCGISRYVWIRLADTFLA